MSCMAPLAVGADNNYKTTTLPHGVSFNSPQHTRQVNQSPAGSIGLHSEKGDWTCTFPPILCRSSLITETYLILCLFESRSCSRPPALWSLLYFAARAFSLVRCIPVAQSPPTLPLSIITDHRDIIKSIINSHSLALSLWFSPMLARSLHVYRSLFHSISRSRFFLRSCSCSSLLLAQAPSLHSTPPG